MIRAPLSDAQRAEVLRRLQQGDLPGEIAYRTGLHRRDVETIAAGAGIPAGERSPGGRAHARDGGVLS